MSRADATGWYGVSAREMWTCPECGETSPVEEWSAGEAACDDCGSHDARYCPRCREEYDHVHGSRTIEEASAAARVAR